MSRSASSAVLGNTENIQGLRDHLTHVGGHLLGHRTEHRIHSRRNDELGQHDRLDAAFVVEWKELLQEGLQSIYGSLALKSGQSFGRIPGEPLSHTVADSGRRSDEEIPVIVEVMTYRPDVQPRLDGDLP